MTTVNPPPPGKGALIKGTLLIKQGTHECGPAALATVLKFYGMQVTLEEVREAVYSEKLKGTLTIDMLLYAKSLGLHARHYAGSIEDIKARLLEGKPLILFTMRTFGRMRLGHYIVVLGFNDADGTVIASMGRGRLEALTIDKLQRLWARGGFSTLLIEAGDVKEGESLL